MGVTILCRLKTYKTEDHPDSSYGRNHLKDLVLVQKTQYIRIHQYEKMVFIKLKWGLGTCKALDSIPTDTERDWHRGKEAEV